MKLRYAVIGDPISHSRSPELYEPMFRRFGIDAEFLRLRITREELPSVRETVQRFGLRGFAVTMPHKRDIACYLDAISEDARTAGAVNIVTIHENTLTGHNTDGDGLINALRGQDFSAAGKNALILGGGGAAHGTAAALMRNGCSVEFVTRSPGGSMSSAIAVCERRDMLRSADLLINATPLGMRGYPDFDDLDFLGRLKPSAIVFDLVYAEGGTRLQNTAASLGLRVLGGESLLYHQGLLAFKLWTGLDPNDGGDFVN